MSVFHVQCNTGDIPAECGCWSPRWTYRSNPQTDKGTLVKLLAVNAHDGFIAAARYGLDDV